MMKIYSFVRALKSMLQIFNDLNYICGCIRKSNTKDKQLYTTHIDNVSRDRDRAGELIMYAHSLKNLDKQSVRKPKWGEIALFEVRNLFPFFFLVGVCVFMYCHIFSCTCIVFHFFSYFLLYFNVLVLMLANSVYVCSVFYCSLTYSLFYALLHCFLLIPLFCINIIRKSFLKYMYQPINTSILRIFFACICAYQCVCMCVFVWEFFLCFC